MLFYTNKSKVLPFILQEKESVCFAECLKISCKGLAFV